MKWYQEKGHSDDVVLSSRIRLARNIKKYPFPLKMTEVKAIEVIDYVKSEVYDKSPLLQKEYMFYKMDELSPVDRISLMERHSVSPFFLRQTIPTGLMISNDEGISVMVNEEDHLRIQAMVEGMNLKKAYEYANALDDLLEESIDYAFDEKVGYLTVCPTNVGTGMRASYMLHLPALESTGQIQLILDAVNKFGMTIRGLYGEGTEAQGSLFQISNQITLGHTEEDIIDYLNTVTMQVVDQERKLRQKMFHENHVKFEDAIFRSYGILTTARMISSNEAMTLLSDIKLGIEMGILKLESLYNSYEFMANIQPASLQKMFNMPLQGEERDIKRAELIRNFLPKLKLT